MIVPEDIKRKLGNTLLQIVRCTLIGWGGIRIGRGWGKLGRGQSSEISRSEVVRRF